jgi:hypothetical protein
MDSAPLFVLGLPQQPCRTCLLRLCCAPRFCPAPARRRISLCRNPAPPDPTPHPRPPRSRPGVPVQVGQHAVHLRAQHQAPGPEGRGAVLPRQRHAPGHLGKQGGAERGGLARHLRSGALLPAPAPGPCHRDARTPLAAWPGRCRQLYPGPMGAETAPTSPGVQLPAPAGPGSQWLAASACGLCKPRRAAKAARAGAAGAQLPGRARRALSSASCSACAARNACSHISRALPKPPTP